ncbi:MAG: translation initiation factor IF-3 [Candidatus Izemoplasmatales bacterium]|nr:translation initiation factor IF-3 [bacterium]MDZ4196790.1 translation initiation factor IF-3 [Candidatus Izemoplasmatales bacterium]
MFAKWVLRYPFFNIQEVFFIYNNKQPVRKDETLINEDIRFKEVLLIGVDGFQFGTKPTREALYIAQKENLDLVCVAPTATPPVCKLMNYSKFRYEQQRKAREAKKNQHIVELKEIRLSAVIDTHDFETKLRHGQKFLSDGNKVKISIRLPYRAGVPLITQGKEVIRSYIAGCAEVGDPERDIVQEGRNLSITVSAKKK